MNKLELSKYISYNQKTFERRYGYKSLFLEAISQELKANPSEQYPNIITFLSSDNLNVQTYKKLSIKEKKLIKNCMPTYPYIAAFETLPIAKQIKRIFDQKFGINQYTFVSIGRSPAMIGRILEYLGVDVKYMPISGLQGRWGNFTSNKKALSKYINFLAEQGISYTSIKETGKKTVFCDYTNRGNTLKKVIKFTKNSLNLPSELIAFSSLNRFLEDNPVIKENTYLKKIINKFINHYWSASKSEDFSHIPKVEYMNIGAVKRIMAKYKPGLLHKLFDFCILDMLEHDGIPLKETLLSQNTKNLQKNTLYYMSSMLNGIQFLLKSIR